MTIKDILVHALNNLITSVSIRQNEESESLNNRTFITSGKILELALKIAGLHHIRISRPVLKLISDTVVILSTDKEVSLKGLKNYKRFFTPDTGLFMA